MIPSAKSFSPSTARASGPVAAVAFDATLARLCVLASARAYTDATDSDRGTNTQYLIVELSDRVIVAFRGTKEIEDFITDADFLTMSIDLNSDARVHRGFWLAFISVQKGLTSRLDEIVRRRGIERARQGITTPIPIVFTGHSLGAALAVLAAFYLKRFYCVEAVYTFGAPDVGNSEFAKRFNRLMGRATFALGNACDPVTWLPPYRLGFRRVGQFYFLTGVSWLKSGFKLPLAARIFAGAHQVWQNWRHGKLALLTNHHVELYKQRMEKLCACAS